VTETKGRLLVVDDDDAIRKLFERIARRAGYHVETARDGVEALAMLDAADYDITLIDLMMPRLSGYELVQHISLRKKRPIVMVATALTTSDVASVDDTLVRHVIRKPFDVHAVVAALNDAMAKRVVVGAATQEEPAQEEPAPEAPPVNTPLPC